MEKTYSNGSIYIGDHKWSGFDNIKHGQGTLIYCDGTKYEGEFKDDNRHGQGTIIDSNGNKYEGEWKDNKIHGQGTIIDSKGPKYEGEFFDGKRHGHGTLTYSDGSKYKGEWKDNKIHGQGTTINSILDTKYEGEFKDGKQHGHGTLTYSDGSKYKGELRNNKKHGQGTIIHLNGDKYEDKWKNGRKVGAFIVTYSDGTRLSGQYIDDKLQGKLQVIEEIEEIKEKRTYGGYVYILINASYQKDYLKIGYTRRTPEIRAKELSEDTGTPTEFIVAYQKQVYDCENAETLVHKALHRYRVTYYHKILITDYFLIKILWFPPVSKPSANMSPKRRFLTG